MAVSQASSVEKQNGSSSSIKSTSFTPTNSKPFTQRFTVVESSSNGRTDPRQSRRLTGDDGDEGGRQQHGAAAGKGKGKQREEEVRDSATAEHFDKNSKTIQARARAEMRDSLIWVTRLSEGPVDRSVLREAARTMKQNAFRDCLTERHVNHLCAYPPCDQPPRRHYDAEKPVYRINLRAKKVFDTSASTKFCSDECARRAAWYETVCLASNNPLQQHFSRYNSPTGGGDGTRGAVVQLLEDIEDTLGKDSPLPDPATVPSSSDAQVVGPADNAPSSSPLPRASLAAEASPYQRPSSSTPAAAGVYPAPPSSLSEHAVLPAPSVVQDEFSQLAEHFLARLAIIEHTTTSAPTPPSLATASQPAPEDSEPRARTASSVSTGTSRFASAAPNGAEGLMPFDMAPLQRDLLASARQQQIPSTSDPTTSKPGRRVEVDVDPQDQEYMEMGWKLFKQLRESGEMGQ